jgi:hypothetical protein
MSMQEKALRAERLRRAMAAAQERAARESEQAAAYRTGLERGRRDAVENSPLRADSELAKQFVQDALREMAAVQARSLDVPAALVGEVAQELWQAFRADPQMTHPSYRQGFIRWLLDGRGDVQMDIEMPALRFSSKIDRRMAELYRS